jgi:tetratricopeptide (TPR) repeat protein
MKSRTILLALTLHLSAGPVAHAQQSVSTSGPCAAVTQYTGKSVSITYNGGCNIGFSALEVQKIVDAVISGQSVPKEFADRYDALTKEFGVTDAALVTFFRVLGERKVPIEQLNESLQRIAAEHNDLLRKIASLTGNDPQSGELRRQAATAVKNGNYSQAEGLLNQAMANDEKAAKEAVENAQQAQLSVAKTKSELGKLKLAQLQFAAAASIFLEAVQLTPVNEPLARASYLSAAGKASVDAGNFQNGINQLSQALSIYIDRKGPDDPAVGGAALDLGEALFQFQAYQQAEGFLRDALRIAKKTQSPDSPIVAGAMTSLGQLCMDIGKQDEGLTLLVGALGIFEAKLEPTDPAIAGVLNSLGVAYKNLKNFKKAEEYYTRALSIDEKAFGPDGFQVAVDLNNLGAMYAWQNNNYAKARPYQERAAQIIEKSLGPDHLTLGYALVNLASVYEKTGNQEEAKLRYTCALGILDKTLGPNHPTTKNLRKSLSLSSAPASESRKASKGK